MEPFLASVMPPSAMGPPSPRAVNDQTVFHVDRDEFADRVSKHEAFLRAFVEPLPFALGVEFRDPSRPAP